MFIIRDLLHWLSRYRLKLIVLIAAAVWGAVWVWPDSKLTLVFCAVGQGDASIISRGFTQVLIDAGPASARTAACLGRRLPFFDHRLEAVIISHPQLDHFGGLPGVLNRYQVDKFIFNGIAGDSRAWEELSQLVEDEKSQVVTLAAGSKLKVGEIEINVLWPQLDTKGPTFGAQRLDLENPNEKVLGVRSIRDLNADALVLALSYGDFSALFTGDIGEKEESVISSRFSVLGSKSTGFQSIGSQPANRKPITVLKVAHHGSKTSSSAGFLSAVRPKLAVIEVGKNSYGHPADEVIKRLEDIGAKVLRTDRDGDVVVETDGKKWQIQTQNAKFKSQNYNSKVKTN